MFIPHCSNVPEKGDKVVLNENLEVFGGMFTIGHIFKIIEKNENNYTLEDDDFNIVHDVHISKISIFINLIQAINDTIAKQKIEVKLKIIEECCEYRDNAWKEYIHFYYCKLNNKLCEVNLLCEKHCDKIKLRKYKINVVDEKL